MMFFDIVLNYEEAAELVKAAGFDGWLRFMQGKFPSYKLYATSTDWYSIGKQFICKFRGTDGDVIVGWKE